jgi:tripartite-type tricarboxylate transporter receptor subunit TctC
MLLICAAHIAGRTPMRLPRRRFLRLTAGAAALPALSRIAPAQVYPARPVHLIIGYTPGGSADLTARLIGQWLSERLGQTIVVDSRPGGGTIIATEAVVHAPPDGYTLRMQSTPRSTRSSTTTSCATSSRWPASTAFPMSWR